MKAILLALICGALTALSLPRPGLCLLAWVSLAPLFVLWRRAAGWRPAALLGLAAGFGYHGVVLYWIFSTCRFAGLSVAVAALAWGSLALFLALNWALVGALGRRVAEKRPGARVWAWAAIWTAVAFASERWTPRLGADLLAYTQWRHLALLQAASLAGPHFLGFLVVAANAALARAGSAWTEGGESKPRAAADLGAVLAAVTLCFAYGAFELSRRGAAAGGAGRVALLQPAIDQYEKFDGRQAERIRANFDELLARPWPQAPDLVVWPETSLPDLVEAGRPVPEASAWGRRLGAAQIVGAVSRDAGGLRNSAFFLAPDGRTRAVYHKRRLVPFGEFVPFQFLGRFVGILNQLGGLTPGDRRQALFATPFGLAAAGICYEAAFPSLVRGDAARGAALVFNLTNDGWYKDTWGPYQHFWLNVYRAIENRVTIVRCGNTGISGVIDPWGVVIAASRLNARGRLDAEVPAGDRFPRRSFYARHGDWFGWLCLLAAGALAAAGLRRP
ncbi:MAG: apolipoprotein N-acyltransferase [Elusimicrobia bacterium]|nr:apolipoprotein N-acyltransferase [Elusimicrobiota bacterium]